MYSCLYFSGHDPETGRLRSNFRPPTCKRSVLDSVHCSRSIRSSVSPVHSATHKSTARTRLSTRVLSTTTHHNPHRVAPVRTPRVPLTPRPQPRLSSRGVTQPRLSSRVVTHSSARHGTRRNVSARRRAARRLAASRLELCTDFLNRRPTLELCTARWFEAHSRCSGAPSRERTTSDVAEHDTLLMRVECKATIVAPFIFQAANETRLSCGLGQAPLGYSLYRPIESAWDARWPNLISHKMFMAGSGNTRAWCLAETSVMETSTTPTALVVLMVT